MHFLSRSSFARIPWPSPVPTSTPFPSPQSLTHSTPAPALAYLFGRSLCASVKCLHVETHRRLLSSQVSVRWASHLRQYIPTSVVKLEELIHFFSRKLLLPHLCMCACVHAHVHVCACVHVCMCACVHVCMCACVHVHLHLCACALVCMCACVNVWLSVCACTCLRQCGFGAFLVTYRAAAGIRVVFQLVSHLLKGAGEG
jgi:hypothetical protein